MTFVPSRKPIRKATIVPAVGRPIPAPHRVELKQTQAQQVLDREIAMLKAALGDRPASDAFLTTTAPLSVEPGRNNEHYASDEEHVYAIAEAMRVEYETIATAVASGTVSTIVPRV